jgi:hypothetical protein
MNLNFGNYELRQLRSDEWYLVRNGDPLHGIWPSKDAALDWLRQHITWRFDNLRTAL